MGPVVAVVYALLMIYAYGSQIKKSFKAKKTEGLSFKFFFIAWCAVALRMTNVGVVIKQTLNVSAIALEIAEGVVFFGLLTIVGQIIYYKYSKKHRRQDP